MTIVVNLQKYLLWKKNSNPPLLHHCLRKHLKTSIIFLISTMCESLPIRISNQYKNNVYWRDLKENPELCYEEEQLALFCKGAMDDERLENVNYQLIFSFFFGLFIVQQFSHH